MGALWIIKHMIVLKKNAQFESSNKLNFVDSLILKHIFN